MQTIDRSSHIPCYYQVYRHLKSNIQNNVFNNGERLPSERTLSEQFSVNRFTIRRAVENLITDGLVYPVRRKGYYVKSDGIEIPINKKTSYTKNMLEKKLVPRVDILEMETIDPSPDLRNLFELDKNDKVWSIYFLRYYNDIPMALSQCYLPYSRMPDLNIHIIKKISLYKILNTNYAIAPSRTDSICEACLGDRIENKHLCILGGVPLLKVTSTAVDQNGRYIEQSITKFRADMVKLKVNLKDL